MATDPKHYTEPLAAKELDFLKQKEAKDRVLYYKIYKILMTISFVIPFATSWVRAIEGQEAAFSIFRYFLNTAMLLIIFSITIYFTYRYNLRRVQRDIREGTKTVEVNRIKRKAFFPSSDTYYFYIDSKIKLSIEVSSADYARLDEGDEVCIEYSTHSRHYIGYF